MGLALALGVGGCARRDAANPPDGQANSAADEPAQDTRPPEYRDDAFSDQAPADLKASDLPPRRFDVIDVHEHVLNLELAERLANIQEEFRIVHTVLMGTSRYTFTLDENDGFESHHDNNEEILRIAAARPEQFSAFVTLHPPEEGNLERLQDYVRRGARGLKLYLGHGAATGKGPFHMMPLDDPRMMPIYAYCEQIQLPIVYHINLTEYYDEFVAVMEQFPRLRVCVPHFGLHKNTEARLRRLAGLFERYPNLYSDIGFGWWEFHIDGFKQLARRPQRFREFLTRHADRFMFSTDMVLEPTKSDYYIRSTLRSYLQMLEMEYFRFFYLLDVPIRGLNLPEEALRKIYWDTPRRFLGMDPAATPPVPGAVNPSNP